MKMYYMRGDRAMQTSSIYYRVQFYVKFFLNIFLLVKDIWFKFFVALQSVVNKN